MLDCTLPVNFDLNFEPSRGIYVYVGEIYKNSTSCPLQADQDQRDHLVHMVRLENLDLKENLVTLGNQDKLAAQEQREIREDQEAMANQDVMEMMVNQEDPEVLVKREIKDVQEAMANQEQREIGDHQAIQVK